MKKSVKGLLAAIVALQLCITLIIGSSIAVSAQNGQVSGSDQPASFVSGTDTTTTQAPETYTVVFDA